MKRGPPGEEIKKGNIPSLGFVPNLLRANWKVRNVRGNVPKLSWRPTFPHLIDKEARIKEGMFPHALETSTGRGKHFKFAPSLEKASIPFIIRMCDIWHSS